ncbi:MAG: beta-lactamase family protein [Asgard group archaeon]|nr:beta-lactamase family protein [Asgard group archaeon]
MLIKKGRIVVLLIIVGNILLITNLGNNNYNSNIIDISNRNEFLSITESYTAQDIDNVTELESFLDGFIPNQLEQHSVPGMTLSIVKDNELLFAKGYGNRTETPSVNPVIANQTLFRIGSVSKLFTAVAVLQLVENSTLNLDTDVNNYFTAFQIPDTFEEPITLRHLLTHTPGFEEKAYPSIFSSQLGIPSLEEFCIEILPDRVHSPGTITSYSNYGFTLMGYIIEQVSGKTFEDYIEDEIFFPLGMNSSTFKEPLPTVHMLTNMSTGFFESGYPGFFEYLSVVPAGSCSSTATDMAKFMIALLDNGHYNGYQMLLNETVEIMQEEHFTTHPNLPGVCLSLYEFDTHDTHIIGHSGDTIFFHSLMALIPEDDLGFFVSYNSQTGSIARDEFFAAFFDQYYPHNIEVVPMKNYGRNLGQYTVLYLSTRRYYSDKYIEPLTFGFPPYEIIEQDYLDEAWFITKSSDGRLQLLGLEFIQVEPDYFIESTGTYDLEIAFIRNKRGRITNFYTSIAVPMYSFEKIHPIYTTPEGFNFILLLIEIIILGVSITWGITALIRKKKKIEVEESILPSVAKWLNVGVIAFSIVPFILLITNSYADLLRVQDSYIGLNGFIVFPILTVILIAGMITFSTLSWIGIGNKNKKPYWKLWDRILYTVVTVLSLGLIVYFVCFNLLGY